MRRWGRGTLGLSHTLMVSGLIFCAACVHSSLQGESRDQQLPPDARSRGPSTASGFSPSPALVTGGQHSHSSPLGSVPNLSPGNSLSPLKAPAPGYSLQLTTPDAPLSRLRPSGRRRWPALPITSSEAPALTLQRSISLSPLWPSQYPHCSTQKALLLPKMPFCSSLPPTHKQASPSSLP